MTSATMSKIECEETIMIRRYTPQDRKAVYEMFVEFYNSPAVLHNVDTQYFSNTLDQLDAGCGVRVSGRTRIHLMFDRGLSV